MKKGHRAASLVIVILFFTLGMSVLGFIPRVNGATLTVNSQWCSSSGGTWDGATSTCTNPICTQTPATVAAGQNLTIPQGTTLAQSNDCWITVNGILENHGTIQLQSGSLLIVNGSFTNFGLVQQAGTIQVYSPGTMVNEPEGKVMIGVGTNYVGSITNEGRISNQGTIDVCGNITNEGEIDNYKNITDDNCHVSGRGGGNLSNSGRLVEECGGFLIQVSGSTLGGNTATSSCTVTITSSSTTVSSTSAVTTSRTTSSSTHTATAPQTLPTVLVITAVIIGLGVIAGLGYFMRGRIIGRVSKARKV